MKDYKKINTYSVSEDEKALMKEINFFYKTHSSKITEDILYFPSGIDNDKTSGLNVPYNSAEMKNIDSGFSLKYVTELITPCCKIDDTVEPALVKGKSED